jgi:hypothetical protein
MLPEVKIIGYTPPHHGHMGTGEKPCPRALLVHAPLLRHISLHVNECPFCLFKENSCTSKYTLFWVEEKRSLPSFLPLSNTQEEEEENVTKLKK